MMGNIEKAKPNKQELSYYQFYKNNLKFYLAGFFIAVWVFIILFVLGFVSINKTPNILLNPKVLTTVQTEAFWALVDTEEPEENILWNPVVSIFTSYPLLYHIWEKQIPSLSSNYKILKQDPTKKISINGILKDLRLPEISTSPLKGGNLKEISFSDKSWKYEISIDRENITIKNSYELSLKEDVEDNGKEISNISQKEIEKEIEKFISSFGLSLKYYDDPILAYENDLYVSLFYPLILNNRPVRQNEERQEGMYVNFNKSTNQIELLTWYNTKSYQVSKYPFNKTKKELLNQLQSLWNIDITKKGKDDSVVMNKGENIYLEKDSFLIPALLFQQKEGEKIIILPLY